MTLLPSPICLGNSECMGIGECMGSLSVLLCLNNRYARIAPSVQEESTSAGSYLLVM